MTHTAAAHAASALARGSPWPEPKRRAKGFLVTGTDTGVGKTRVAAVLLSALCRAEFRAVGMKPVAAGIEPGEDTNADVLALDQAGNVAALLDDRCPYAFAPAIAPHLAAAKAGVRVDLARLCAAYRRLEADADWVVVEGAGGALVPLNEEENLLDFAKALNLPVILVVGLRLGCLNHALLTAEAIAGRGLDLAGWVANVIDPEMVEREANLRYLVDHLPGPCLACLPWQTDGPLPPSLADRAWQALQSSLGAGER